MTILEHIDELKAELNAVLDADERRQIEAELKVALAKCEIFAAKEKSRIDTGPPS